MMKAVMQQDGTDNALWDGGLTPAEYSDLCHLEHGLASCGFVRHCGQYV